MIPTSHFSPETYTACGLLSSHTRRRKTHLEVASPAGLTCRVLTGCADYLQVPGKIQQIISTGNVCDRETWEYLRGVAPDLRGVRGEYDEVRARAGTCRSPQRSANSKLNSAEPCPSAISRADAWSVADRSPPWSPSGAAGRHRGAQRRGAQDGRGCTHLGWNTSVRLDAVAARRFARH